MLGSAVTLHVAYASQVHRGKAESREEEQKGWIVRGSCDASARKKAKERRGGESALSGSYDSVLIPTGSGGEKDDKAPVWPVLCTYVVGREQAVRIHELAVGDRLVGSLDS